jgi:hypothetical protein
MDLKIFKTLWGHVGSFEAACADAVKVGFDGIEGPSHSSRAVRNAYQRTLNDHGLEYIAEITTGGSYVPDAGSDPAAHFASFQRKLEHSLETQSAIFKLPGRERSVAIRRHRQSFPEGSRVG